ncbi:hypothetical protein H6P81_021103 [Aristolochia fimbriata]|uniref:Uncharacterized protein n=1 Tax=Aristolochia fimbriata TaxID=158543 RepID=A0AAV7DX69_ARIFI|nr:hypothetical protein H6P81_021103 [Aristolochia fimbriata]
MTPIQAEAGQSFKYRFPVLISDRETGEGHYGPFHNCSGHGIYRVLLISFGDFYTLDVVPGKTNLPRIINATVKTLSTSLGFAAMHSVWWKLMERPYMWLRTYPSSRCRSFQAHLQIFPRGDFMSQVRDFLFCRHVYIRVSVSAVDILVAFERQLLHKCC